MKHHQSLFPQFKSYTVNPRAKNSGMLNLVKMIDPSIQALKGDLSWYKDMLLGQPVNLVVGSYVNKNGETKNTIKSITPTPHIVTGKQIGRAHV